ncbi:subtilisin-like protease Glyma18g48580, partial [Neltuma alba]|uniref:subtilisin-like protease Glyma18g48580 n=1 Tax=Neltuma alba TaxID=207710 RepID=UPI0010A39BB7
MTGLSVFHFLLSSILLLSCVLLQYQPVHAIKKYTHLDSENACQLFESCCVWQSYVVYLGSHSHDPNPSANDQDSATSFHYSLLASHLGSRKKAKEAIFYSYNRHINGFAALLEEEEAADIAKNPKVVSVFMNRGHKLQTTRSWEFLGLENSNGQVLEDSIWEKARYGEDTIIGNIDTGVWPESRSFSDEGMGPIPSRWRGACQLDNFRCNRKLIGARFFSNGYESQFGKLNESLYTARDELGHGTPTLSVAGVTSLVAQTFLASAMAPPRVGPPEPASPPTRSAGSLSPESNVPMLT